jgi:branched-chain amino acid transport system substrate-binding protein
MRLKWWGLVVALLMVVAACGNSKDSGSGGAAKDTAGHGPGVSDTEIKVGGLAAVNNPLGGNYGDSFEGAQAYFDKVNAEGGVFNRKINMAAKRDDGAQASRNVSQARALVEEDGVFAVVPVATISFSGAKYLGESGVPTFGWNINAEWSGPPNLFGQTGSYLCFDCPNAWLSYVAKQSGFTKIGVLTYTAPQSQECAKGWKASIDKFGAQLGISLVYETTSINFGFTPPELGPELDKMKSAGVQFLVTCVDGAGSVKLAKAFKDNSLDIVQYLPNGYDDKLIADSADVLEGDFVTIPYFPYQAPEAEQPQALKDFVAAMKARGKEPNENSLAGWINADQLVQGIKEAGPDFNRQKVVDAINKETNYTAGGILPGGVNWTIAHTADSGDSCATILQVKAGKLVPVFGQPGKPHLCFVLANPDFDHPTFK